MFLNAYTFRHRQFFSDELKINWITATYHYSIIFSYSTPTSFKYICSFYVGFPLLFRTCRASSSCEPAAVKRCRGATTVLERKRRACLCFQEKKKYKQRHNKNCREVSITRTILKMHMHAHALLPFQRREDHAYILCKNFLLLNLLYSTKANFSLHVYSLYTKGELF